MEMAADRASLADQPSSSRSNYWMWWALPGKTECTSVYLFGVPRRQLDMRGVLQPSASSIGSVPSKSTGPGFLKNLTIDSFGFSSAPVKSALGSPGELTNGPFTMHGLECA